MSETMFSFENVGAIMDRPPKNAVFRIFRRKIALFSPCGDGFCLGKIHGRFLNRPYTYENTAHHLVGGIVHFSRFSNVEVL